MQGILKLCQLIRLGEQVCETFVIDIVFVAEVCSIHLIGATDWLGDVVKDGLAGCSLIVGVKSETNCFLAVASKHLNLVRLEVIVEAKSPADFMLVHSFGWGVNERIRENQVVQVELE